MTHKQYSDSQNVLQTERVHYVTDNLSLVYYILNKKLHVSMSDAYYDDYIQEGMCALTLAAARYDEESGTSFATFASTYIEGYMRRYRREFVNSTLHIPRRMLDAISDIYSLQNEGYGYNEIAEKLHMKGTDISHLMYAISPSSLEAPISSDTDYSLTLSDVVPGDTGDSNTMESDRHIDYCIDLVAKSLHNEMHKGLWYDYIYSAVFDIPAFQSELAKKYHISQSYVAKILIKAKNRFRQYMNDPDS